MVQADLGLIGLGVMGQNLALNFNDHGIRLAGYDINDQQTKNFLSGAAKGTLIIGCSSLEDLVGKLSRPRRIMLMIKAGTPVDQVIDALVPLLDEGDIIIDGGNSLFLDTNRRVAALAQKGILFLGMGVSGGEEGARFGPALMPGGNIQAWPHVKDWFQAIAAKVDNEPCCQWIGESGAGHYVKMVHNGIEYGDMQLIAEAYQFMHEGIGLDHATMQQVFASWDQGVLNSYLINITAEIMAMKDADGSPLLEKILDTAGQKGTGTWTAVNALEQGVPLTLIGEAVFARCLSAMKDARLAASKVYPRDKKPAFQGDVSATLDALRDALYASKIMSYAQGFMLMQQASDEYGWNLDCGNIALTWRGGCIIRSRFLDKIKDAYDKDPNLTNLLLDDFFVDVVNGSLKGWRQTVLTAVELEVPIPAFSSALAFFDGFRSPRTSANLLQAQRDYFGAHTYERTDKPRGEFFHTDWQKKK